MYAVAHFILLLKGRVSVKCNRDIDIRKWTAIVSNQSAHFHFVIICIFIFVYICIYIDIFVYLQIFIIIIYMQSRIRNKVKMERFYTSYFRLFILIYIYNRTNITKRKNSSGRREGYTYIIIYNQINIDSFSKIS